MTEVIRVLVPNHSPLDLLILPKKSDIDWIHDELKPRTYTQIFEEGKLDAVKEIPFADPNNLNWIPQAHIRNLPIEVLKLYDEERFFIDPFAPVGPYPWQDKCKVCMDCGEKHAEQNKYNCKKCKMVRCSAQTNYKYKDNDPSIVDTSLYVNEIIVGHTCIFCGAEACQI